MPVFVKLSSPVEEKEEIAIVEVQGDLECRTNAFLDSQFVGDLYFKNQGDGTTLPVLIIGHHILNGKVQSLDKPLALMERKKNSNNDVEFVIQAVVSKKICFKTRPKPIISNN